MVLGNEISIIRIYWKKYLYERSSLTLNELDSIENMEGKAIKDTEKIDRYKLQEIRKEC